MAIGNNYCGAVLKTDFTLAAALANAPPVVRFSSVLFPFGPVVYARSRTDHYIFQ